MPLLLTRAETHNPKFSDNYGNRIIMIHQAAFIDADETKKQEYGIGELLKVFNGISIETYN